MNPVGPAITPPDTASNSTDAPPDRSGFAAVLEAYVAGEAELTALRHELSETLLERPETVPVITARLDLAKEAEGLSTAIYRLLLRDIKRITTEETPTDSNIAKAPDDVIKVAESLDSPEPPAGDKPESPSPGRGSSPMAVGLAPRLPLEPAVQKASARADKPFDVGTVLRDRYELVQLIADGSMGRLFRALDRLNDIDATVAIKVLNTQIEGPADAFQRLRREAFNAQRLSHPNIVNVHEIDRHAGSYFISMEWLNGESLASRMDRTRPNPMSRPEFDWIFDGLTKALSYAHEQGVIHGDVKPGNVFLTVEDQIKLIDFGLARGPGEALGTGSDEEPYGLTLNYASCEVHEGQEPTLQDDIFALALLTYRMLAGHRPFGSGNALDAEAKRIKPARPPKISDRQWRTLQKAMAFRRADRFLTVADFAEGMLDVPSINASSSAHRRRWPWAAVAAIVGFTGGVLLSEPVMERSSVLRSQYFPERSTQVSGLPRATVAAPADVSPDTNPVTVPVETESDAASVTLPIEAEPDNDSIATVEPEVQSDGSTELASPAAPVPDETIAPTLNLDSVEPTKEFVRVPPPVEAPVDTNMVGTKSMADSSGAEDTPQIISAEEPAVRSPTTIRPSLPLGFTQDQYTVNEQDGFIRLAVGSPNSLARPLTLRIVIQEGTAIPGEDFAVPGAETVVIEPGSDSAEVFVPLISDSQPEFIEDFVVRLISLDSDYQVVNDEAVVVILDDDGAGQQKPIAN